MISVLFETHFNFISFRNRKKINFISFKNWKIKNIYAKSMYLTSNDLSYWPVCPSWSWAKMLAFLSNKQWTMATASSQELEHACSRAVLPRESQMLNLIIRQSHNLFSRRSMLYNLFTWLGIDILLGVTNNLYRSSTISWFSYIASPTCSFNVQFFQSNFSAVIHVVFNFKQFCVKMYMKITHQSVFFRDFISKL